MTRPRKTAPLPPGVSRTDEPAYRKHGYTVRIGWTKPRKGQHNKPLVKAFFGDYGHGGEAKARAAAVRFAARHQQGTKGGR